MLLQGPPLINARVSCNTSLSLQDEEIQSNYPYSAEFSGGGGGGGIVSGVHLLLFSECVQEQFCVTTLPLCIGLCNSFTVRLVVVKSLN